MRVLIVDADPEVVEQQWRDSGCEAEGDELILPSLRFDSMDLVLQRIEKEDPGAIILGFRLGTPVCDGADLALFIPQISGAYIIANSSKPSDFSDVKAHVDGFANRDPRMLAETFKTLGPPSVF
jgi:hypothetical protein